MDRTTGYVSEIFCSVQGEGPMVGQRQIFFRTAGCTADCRWCDTSYSKTRPSRCRIYGPGDGGVRTLSNPLTVGQAAREVLLVAEEDGSVGTVSITGGEPLEQSEFVTGVAARLKNGGLNVYLETNGIHDHAFAEILRYVDVVAMDIKLPSAFGTPAWDKHEAFLSQIDGTVFDPDVSSRNSDDKRIFVKVVVDDRSDLSEIEFAAQLIASTDARIPLVLQPESETMLSKRTSSGTLRRLNQLLDSGHAAAAAVLEDVRVIPQVHRILKVR
jgi:organic radical activating enzyme